MGNKISESSEMIGLGGVQRVGWRVRMRVRRGGSWRGHGRAGHSGKIREREVVIVER